LGSDQDSGFALEKLAIAGAGVVMPFLTGAALGKMVGKLTESEPKLLGMR
jgi:hypothetical protein